MMIHHGADQVEFVFEKPGFPMVITSFKLYEYCLARYPKRKVVPSAYVEHDDFYYYTRDEILRLVRNKNQVWVGKDWPYIVRRR